LTDSLVFHEDSFILQSSFFIQKQVTFHLLCPDTRKDSASCWSKNYWS